MDVGVWESDHEGDYMFVYAILDGKKHLVAKTDKERTMTVWSNRMITYTPRQWMNRNKR